MGRINVDKSQEFINSGMTLISEPESDRYLSKLSEKKIEEALDEDTES